MGRSGRLAGTVGTGNTLELAGGALVASASQFNADMCILPTCGQYQPLARLKKVVSPGQSSAEDPSPG